MMGSKNLVQIAAFSPILGPNKKDAGPGARRRKEEVESLGRLLVAG